MKTYLISFFALFFFNINRCTLSNRASPHTYVVTINEPDKTKEIRIPLQCSGWCIVGGRVIENTTNDSILVWRKHFAPGETGSFHSMECYACFSDTIPWVTSYMPYKATKGKVVIEWSLTPY